MNDGPVWLTKREAAARARCSVFTIERGIARGELATGGTGPPKRGRRVLIHVDELDAWLARSNTPSVSS